jgi:hypothetical protein
MRGRIGAAVIGLLVMVIAGIGAVRDAAAQKPLPGAGPTLGVSFAVAVTVQEGQGPVETVLTLSGRVNITGELAARLESAALGLDAEAVVVGGRVYARASGGDWLYVDLADLMALLGPGLTDTPRLDSPECMAVLNDYFGRFPDVGALYSEFGTFQAGGPEVIDGIPVLHHAGAIDLGRALALFAPLLVNPACTGGQSALPAGLLAELVTEDLPSIRFDVYVGQADQFPYRFRLVIGWDDEGEATIVMDLRPSQSFFDIQAPPGAVRAPFGALPGR